MLCSAAADCGHGAYVTLAGCGRLSPSAPGRTVTWRPLSPARAVADPAAGHPGEFPRDVEIGSRLAPDDSDQRTIEGVPTRQLSPGVYRVAWWARPAAGGGARQGTFSFGVAMPVPGDSSGNVHTVSERDAGARRRRQTTFGGVLLLALGVLLPWLVPRL